jgi:transcriptional regulator with XRE-family HTH domain
MRKLRQEKGLSQVDIFRRTGLERTYISRLENGEVKDPRVTTVITLARAFGITPEDFIQEMLRLGDGKKKDEAAVKP